MKIAEELACFINASFTWNSLNIVARSSRWDSCPMLAQTSVYTTSEL